MSPAVRAESVAPHQRAFSEQALNQVNGELKRRDIESKKARLRKIIKTRGHLPCDDVATRLIWLALPNITADWGRAANHWRSAMNPLAILCEDRFTKGIA